MYNFLILLVIIVPSYLLADTCQVFLSKKDGKAIIEQNIKKCKSADCEAILKQKSSLCLTKDCRAILEQNEKWCLSWDCQVLIYYLNSKNPVSSLCISPNCKAIIGNNVSIVSNFDDCQMLNYDVQSIEYLLKKWQESKKELFHEFYNNYKIEVTKSIQNMLKEAKPISFTCLNDI